MPHQIGHILRHDEVGPRGCERILFIKVGCGVSRRRKFGTLHDLKSILVPMIVWRLRGQNPMM
jgi:hypothetical protein